MLAIPIDVLFYIIFEIMLVLDSTMYSTILNFLLNLKYKYLSYTILFA